MNTMDITDLTDTELDHYLTHGWVPNLLADHRWADVPLTEYRTLREAEAWIARRKARGLSYRGRVPLRVSEVRYLDGRRTFRVQARQF